MMARASSHAIDCRLGSPKTQAAFRSTLYRGVLQVRLDGTAGTRFAVDIKFYKRPDYCYATTVHKAQGTTVTRT
jgi:hypothetical protein